MTSDPESKTITFDDAQEAKAVMEALVRVYEGCYIMGVLAQLYSELESIAEHA